MDLLKLIGMKNIAEILDEQQLARIGSDCVIGMDIDLASREDWDKKSEGALKIARQMVETKTFPWPGASNVLYPLITSSVIQFAARAYPDIVKGNDIAKARVTGRWSEEKADRANRVSNHMSYQLLEEMEEWEEETDLLLHVLPAVGMCFRKTYFDPVLGRNVSKLILPDNFIVNNATKCLNTTRRKTEKVFLYRNEVIENIRGGLYLDIEKYLLEADGDEQCLHEFLEQHCWLDLDEDGYEEPYIVTVHKDSNMVARITAGFEEAGIQYNERNQIVKIDQVQYFTDFGFIPDPGGGYYKFGFGQFLLHINLSINTTINQLFDAGTLHNTQGGFVTKGFRIKGGTFSLAPNEWKQVDMTGMDLKANILPLPTKTPSAVLFQLLGFLVDAGKQLSSTADVLSGEGQPNTPATTTLALIEQGLKVYTAIYKRIFRSMKKEFKKLFRLNAIYLPDEEYFNFNDSEQFIARDDYNMGDIAIAPVADPNATDIQRLVRAQALMAVPGLNPKVQQRQYLSALKYSAEEIEELTNFEQPPDVKMLEFQAKTTEMSLRMQLEREKALSEISVNESIKILNLAKAEAAEAGPQLEFYKTQVQQMNEMVKAALQASGQKGATDDSGDEVEAGGVPGMAAESGNAGDLPDFEAISGGMGGEEDGFTGERRPYPTADQLPGGDA